MIKLIGLLLLFSTSAFAQSNPFMIYETTAPMGRGEYSGEIKFFIDPKTSQAGAEILFQMMEQFPVDPVCWEVNGETICEIAPGRIVTTLAKEKLSIPGVSLQGNQLFYTHDDMIIYCGSYATSNEEIVLTLSGQCQLSYLIDWNPEGINFKGFLNINFPSSAAIGHSGTTLDKSR